MLKAITRQVSPAISRCELTHLQRQPINLAVAQAQHAVYQAALRSLGVDVICLPAEPDLPDSVFVEDVALVLDELALLTRPGADSRLPEVAGIATALAPFRELRYIREPGRLDGGDILVVGKQIFVGISSRSNASAIQQMQALLQPFGYRVQGIRVQGCLHLKSAVTQVAPGTLLINSAWVDQAQFGACKLIEIDPSEPYAANALPIGSHLLYQPCFPRTLQKLEKAGLQVLPVDASELGKAEGALTCCSLIFTSPG